MPPEVTDILFAGVAGVMVYISLDELLPTSRAYGKGHNSLLGLLDGMVVVALSSLLMCRRIGRPKETTLGGQGQPEHSHGGRDDQNRDVGMDVRSLEGAFLPRGYGLWGDVALLHPGV